MTSRLNVPDLLFAIFLVALGALGFVLSNQLGIGTAAAMGAGYVPRGLSVLIMVYGFGLGARAFFSGRQSLPDIALRPILFVSAAVALFALMLPYAGLAITSFVVVICAGFAAYDVRLRENVVLALILAAFGVLLFVKALGLPIPIWWQ